MGGETLIIGVYLPFVLDVRYIGFVTITFLC